MEVKLLDSSSDLPAVATLLLQLRSQYDLDRIVARITEQQKAGYRIAYVVSGEKVMAAAGFTIGEKLAWGKHIYIDDLVTDESNRSSGVGAFLMRWMKDYARDCGCLKIHLDSSVQKFSAHRFYLREKFNIASHHFSITDLG